MSGWTPEVSGVTECFGAPFLLRPCDSTVDGSNPTQASSLRRWIRCFTINISALGESDKQQIKKVRSKTQPENSETKSTPKDSSNA